MPSSSELVTYYSAMYHEGQEENAFHGLTDFGKEIVPELILKYESSKDVGFRTFIVRVISAVSDPDASGFLRHALRRDDTRIWKAALDGLVTLRAVDDLEHVLDTTFDEPKRSWIIEAIDQAREE